MVEVLFDNQKGLFPASPVKGSQEEGDVASLDQWFDSTCVAS